MLDNSVLPISTAIRNVLTWTIEGIAEPGTWLTGAERVGVAEQARASLAGAPAPTPTVSDELTEVAHAIAEAPADITPEWIDELETRGLDRFTYVEAAGVVCRMSVIDTLAFGLEAAPPDLPAPEDGEARQDCGTRSCADEGMGSNGGTRSCPYEPQRRRRRARVDAQIVRRLVSGEGGAGQHSRKGRAGALADRSACGTNVLSQ